jgi:fused signal recognition particle receptor
MSKTTDSDKKGFFSRWRQSRAAKTNETPTPSSEIEEPRDRGLFSRLKQGLQKTRQALTGNLSELFRRGAIDDEMIEELENQLLMADVGIETTQKVIQKWQEAARQQAAADAQGLLTALKTVLAEVLKPIDRPLVIEPGRKPFVILVVGVNGVGKTTTIGKLAHHFKAQGHSVMLAAGDTFRAAAVEQLQTWGRRHDVPVVAQHTGADSASVIFDALASAQAKGVDVLIADTAGRLHNKDHLMQELAKIQRVLKKLDETAPHETLLVLDAATGQNALAQAQAFSDAVGVTGLVLTKMDGTAKGGILFALADRFAIPIRFVGVGEAADDLKPFVADAFVEALFTPPASHGKSDDPVQ